MVTGIVFYSIAVALLALSFFKDRQKTLNALKKAGKSFIGILPQFLGIIAIVGVLLALLDPATINRILGRSSGFLGVMIASVVGSITLIPGFIASARTAALAWVISRSVMSLTRAICALSVLSLPDSARSPISELYMPLDRAIALSSDTIMSCERPVMALVAHPDTAIPTKRHASAR